MYAITAGISAVELLHKLGREEKMNWIYEAFNGLRENINDLIRTDRPQSPTDLIFIFGSLVMLGLQIYATEVKTTVPHFTEMLVALGSYKAIKVASDRNQKPDPPAAP